MKTLDPGIVVVLASVTLVTAEVGPANAYTTTGCDWGTLNIKVDGSYANGTFSTALDQAISSYHGSTALYLTRQNSSGNSFGAELELRRHRVPAMKSPASTIY